MIQFSINFTVRNPLFLGNKKKSSVKHKKHIEIILTCRRCCYYYYYYYYYYYAQCCSCYKPKYKANLEEYCIYQQDAKK